MATRSVTGWDVHVRRVKVWAGVLVVSVMGMVEAARAQATRAGDAETVVEKLLKVRAPSADWRKAVAGRAVLE